MNMTSAAAARIQAVSPAFTTAITRHLRFVHLHRSLGFALSAVRPGLRLAAHLVDGSLGFALRAPPRSAPCRWLPRLRPPGRPAVSASQRTLSMAPSASPSGLRLAAHLAAA